MTIQDDETLQMYLEESIEHLADIENDLLAIEEKERMQVFGQYATNTVRYVVTLLPFPVWPTHHQLRRIGWHYRITAIRFVSQCSNGKMPEYFRPPPFRFSRSRPAPVRPNRSAFVSTSRTREWNSPPATSAGH